MNTRNTVMKIIAMGLLVASGSAGAQILGGGGINGAVNGTLGGGFGAPGMQGNGSAAGAGSFGAGEVLGGTRDRVRQAGDHTRNAATSTTSATSSKVESARGATRATSAAAASTSANAGRQAADGAGNAASAPAPSEAPSVSPPAGGLLLGGSGSASAEKHAMGRTLAADGMADSATAVDRSGVQHGSSGGANVSAKKDEPAPTPAQ